MDGGTVLKKREMIMENEKPVSKEDMKSKMKWMLLILGILFGLIILWKGFVAIMMKRGFASMSSPTITVSAMKAGYAEWGQHVKSTGSLRAIYGVNVTTQSAGMVTHIYFKPGDFVKQGTVLVQLNADSQIGQLHTYQANAELDRIIYYRDKLQYQARGISKAQLDSDYQNWMAAIGQVELQTATVAKLIITAPFTGRLGICNVSPGQYLNPGDNVTSLQTMDPIYIDFYIPQQQLPLVKINQAVTVTSDSYPNKTFYGKVSTINPIVDNGSRNVLIEATIANPNYELQPGMFALAEITYGTPAKLLTLPQTVVSYNPYGDLVYVIREGKVKGKDHLIAKQVFVKVGDTRGDQVAILSGIQAGDVIVTSGQLKLRNGSPVAINNTLQPANNPNVNVVNTVG